MIAAPHFAAMRIVASARRCGGALPGSLGCTEGWYSRLRRLVNFFIGDPIRLDGPRFGSVARASRLSIDSLARGVGTTMSADVGRWGAATIDRRGAAFLLRAGRPAA